MREAIVKVFKFEELSEKAREHAHYQWLNNWQFGWSDEYKKTLEEFCDRFPVKVRDWEISTSSHSYCDITITCEDGLAEIKGVRLMAHLYTNHFHDLFKGRYFSLWSKRHQNPHWKEGGHAPWGALKSRYSKVMFEPNMGVLTGFCADEEILDPIYEFLKKPRNITYAALLKECTDNWVDAYKNDMEESSTMEAFKEDCESNEYEFTEDGERF